MVFGLVRRNGQGLGAGIRAGSAAFELRLLGPPQERVSTKAHRADRLPHDSVSELRGNSLPLPCGGVLRRVLTSATICPHLGGRIRLRGRSSASVDWAASWSRSLVMGAGHVPIGRQVSSPHSCNGLVRADLSVREVVATARSCTILRNIERRARRVDKGIWWSRTW